MIRALFRLYDIVDPRTGMVNVDKLREFSRLHAAVVVREIEGQLKGHRKAVTKSQSSE